MIFKKVGKKKAVFDDGKPPRALVSTKLVESSRFEVGHYIVLFLCFLVVLLVLEDCTYKKNAELCRARAAAHADGGSAAARRNSEACGKR